MVNKVIIFLLALIIAVLAVGIGYFAFQNQALLKTVTNKPTQAPQSTPFQPIADKTPAPSPKAISLLETQQSINTNTNNKDHTGLIPFMVKKDVSLVIYASECCQPQTPQAALDQLNYVNEGIPFDFNQDQDIVKNLKAKNPQLADSYIGISKNKEYLAAFTVDNSTNLIKAIQMSVSYKLYTQ